MKKGFTLIELLATIIILALIALVTYPIIDNIVSDSREDLYAKQIAELERHGNTWVTKNLNSLRREPRYVRKITYVDLKNESLIADANVKDPRTGDPLPGCVLAIWNSEITNFDVQYDDDCTYDGPTIIPGDVNLDGYLTEDDLTILNRYAKGTEALPTGDALLAADLNGDGKITTSDIGILNSILQGNQ